MQKVANLFQYGAIGSHQVAIFFFKSAKIFISDIFLVFEQIVNGEYALAWSDKLGSNYCAEG